MLNGIFVVIVLFSILMAAFTGRMEMLSNAVLESARSAVTLALGLIGVMAFFLGLMRVAADGGLLRIMARAVHPVMRFLFPAIPKDHPAMSAMILNITSNLLGLGNAATPFGLKAMMELDRLNNEKGTATDAMVLFLALNTSGLALLPLGVISLRAAAGSQDAAGIMATTWFASGCATVAAIVAATLLARTPRYRLTKATSSQTDQDRRVEAPSSDQAPAEDASMSPRSQPHLVRPRWGKPVVLAFYLALLAALAMHIVQQMNATPTMDLVRSVMSFWMLPALIAGLVLFGWTRGVKVYESLVEGAKEGFQVAVKIIPYLVAILVAIGIFRASGGLELLAKAIGPLTNLIGMPAEALPVALVRPLSGSGALGVMTEIMNAQGPDSFTGYMVCTFNGSTDTTFYILAVYFGSVGIKKTRHALPACLTADVTGILAAVLIVNLLFG